MSIVDEYIIQHFKARDSDNPETDDAYRARLCWIKHDFPPIKDVDKLCNLKKGMATYYSHKYCWKDIKVKIRELEAEQELIDFRNKQKATEKTHDKRNEIVGKAFEKRLQQLLSKVGVIEGIPKDPNLTVEDENEIWDEIYTLSQRISVVQKDERTSAHLPNNYKDVTADLKLQAETTNTNLNFNVKTTDEVLDENADTIKRFIERRMHTTDSTTN